ncbi:GumC family protein [Limnoraphis robusta]|uniref:GumC family protein n=1 Tax=Limnoraphis robusta TaxID=1118279 RepID=UPI002B1F5F95|nr:polysaccharide biosynthesis tyrosine autokinase [Limnoraphis robusta]MEA5496049.1 polysaccharide biosynthesis tyrosine autokinase [Limnoraphis robusta BA-68 BA1]
MEDRESIDLDIGKYLQTVKRYWLIVISVFLLCVGLSVYGTKYLKPTYAASGKLLFKVDRTSSLAGIGEGLGELKALLADQTPLSTQIEIISSNRLLNQVIEQLNLVDDEGKLIDPQTIRNSLEVKIIGGTDIVSLSYESPDPLEAANIVNTLMEVYIQTNVNMNQDEAREAREFISQQLPPVQQEVFRAEQALRSFKEKNQVLDLEEEFRTAVLEQAELNRKITVLESELSGVNALAESLQTQAGFDLEEAIAINTLSQSPVLIGILTELENVESELVNERKRFKDKNPRIIALKQKRDSLNAALQEQVEQALGSQAVVPEGLLQVPQGQKNNQLERFIANEIQRVELTRQLESLYASRRNYEQRSQNLPQLEQEQQELQRKVQVAQVTYETLLKNLEEVQVAENKSTNNARVIEEAVAPETGSTAKTKLIALGIMLGLVGATTSVLILAMGDQNVRTVEEAKKTFRYTLLGIIPMFKSKRLSRYFQGEKATPDIPVVEASDSFISEIYRMLQANLKFLSSDKRIKTIVVTSSVPKEGKSTVSANLSATLAQLGYRVMLIDADMRQPSQHHLWGLTNAVGLSDILVGQAELSSVIRQGIERLDIIPSGVTPPNPLALLDSKRMTSLIRNFSEDYDFVIIDTPPLILAADALTLSQMASGVLLVARPRVLDRASAKSAKEMLERSNQRVLGLVVNAISKNESAQYFYHAKRYFPTKKVKPQIYPKSSTRV